VQAGSRADPECVILCGAAEKRNARKRGGEAVSGGREGQCDPETQQCSSVQRQVKPTVVSCESSVSVQCRQW